MMLTIQCPGCGMKTCLSLIERSYRGPFRCWQCRATFVIVIENEKIKSLKPMTEEEFAAKDKKGVGGFEPPTP